jgi:hypothetical protein
MRRIAILALALLMITGCGRLVGMRKTFHQRCGWKAEDYFTDPKVIALCHAIEANDLAEMERLVQAGADVNAQGKGNMTPLLWAFPDDHLPRFKWLLEHGADPNVKIESEFNTRGFMVPGDAVTHFVCKTAFPGYFEAVFEHGGDPNLRTSRYEDVPLTLVIKGGGGGNRAEMIRKLVAIGADPDMFSGQITPAIDAVTQNPKGQALAAMPKDAVNISHSVGLCGLLGSLFRDRPLFDRPQPVTRADLGLACLAVGINTVVAVVGWLLWKAGWIRITHPAWWRTGRKRTGIM